MFELDIPTLTTAFIGGLLLSLASSINFILKGRLTGMSSILNGLIKFDDSVTWKSSVFSGLMFSACICYYLYEFQEFQPKSSFYDSPKVFASGTSYIITLLSGFLVGFGTKLSNGCTTGHGVCGLPRFNLRSLVAVLTFMATGVATANLRGYIIQPTDIVEMKYDPSLYVKVFFMVSLTIIFINIVTNKTGSPEISDIFISFFVGVIAGFGLLYSGMTRRSKVLGFLTLDSNWDPSLLAVMGGAVMGNLITFNFATRVLKKPLLVDCFDIPKHNKIDLKLVLGAVLFGIGWGLNGICPGPAMVVAPVYFPLVMMFYVPGMITGQMLGDRDADDKIKVN